MENLTIKVYGSGCRMSAGRITDGVYFLFNLAAIK